MTKFRLIESDVDMIRLTVEKHQDQLAEVTVKLLLQLCRNIQRNSSDLRGEILEFANHIASDP
jgi:hypothetical protein